MADIVSMFSNLRRISNPITAFTTADQIALVSTLGRSIAPDLTEPIQVGPGPNDVKRYPVLLFQWDYVRGILPVPRWNGTAWVKHKPTEDTLRDLGIADKTNPVDAVASAQALPPCSVLFFHNAANYLNKQLEGAAAFIQGVANLREPFKATRRMAALLGPEFQLPPELTQDVVVADDPLPRGEQISQIVNQELAYSRIPPLEPAEARKAQAALRSLSPYAISQAVAMSLDLKTRVLDFPSLWTRKRDTVNRTAGLAFLPRTGSGYASLGGLENGKTLLSRILGGKTPINLIVFQDELDKMMAGVGGDLSGVSDEFLGFILTEMQEKGYVGLMFLGPPGTGKSALAQAAATEADIEVIKQDVAGAKASLIGESLVKLKQQFRTIEAASDGYPLFIATANSVAKFPPELRRRYSLPPIFFDVPDEKERSAVWPIWMRKYELPNQEIPADEGWTGAEIRQCCDLSYRMGCTLLEAAAYIVPVTVSAREKIDALRKESDRKYISASYPGLYRYTQLSDTGGLQGRAMLGGE